MMTSCPDRGALRAALDGRPSRGWDAPSVRAHVEACSACRERLAALAAERDAAAARLADDAPAPDVRAAYRRLTERMENEPASPVAWRWWMNRWQAAGRLRPALLGALAMVAVLSVFSYAPARAWAGQILAAFRVKQVVAVRLDPGALAGERGDSVEDWARQFLPDEPEVLVDEPVRQVASVEEASSVAGFTVRAPAVLPVSDGATMEIEVKGRTEFAVPYTRDALEGLLMLAEMDPEILPADLGPGEVHLAFSAGAHLEIEDVEIVQFHRPEVQYPEGVDARLMGEAGLRIAGFPAAEARRFAEAIDWTSTVVLPIPAEVAEFREVQVAGSPAVLITPQADDEGRYRTRSGGPFGALTRGNTLIWERDDVLYLVTSARDSTVLVDIASSMF